MILSRQTMTNIVCADFFDRDAITVAKDLLGKVIAHNHYGIWLKAKIIETEAYYAHEKGSHSSLGFTEKRKALFMPPGTIYMYYARGADSFNVSCRGEGNAVLLKSGIPYLTRDSEQMLHTMYKLNPTVQGLPRAVMKLCSGQTLLCRALGLKVTEWNQQTFKKGKLVLEDVGYRAEKIIQTTRMGIPLGRDEHLPYRFIDFHYAKYCTSNPLNKKNWHEGSHYSILNAEK